MNDRKRFTERLPGLGWVVALVSLLLLAIFSALWLPEMSEDGGVLDDLGITRSASSLREGAVGDSSRGNGSSGGVRAEAVRPAEHAIGEAPSPIAAVEQTSAVAVAGDGTFGSSSRNEVGGRVNKKMLDRTNRRASGDSAASSGVVSAGGRSRPTPTAATAPSRETNRDAHDKDKGHNKSKERHGHGRGHHRKDNAHHRKEKAKHRKDKANHRKDKVKHRKDKAKHRKDKAKHRKDKAKHRKDKAKHRKDKAHHRNRPKMKNHSGGGQDDDDGAGHTHNGSPHGEEDGDDDGSGQSEDDDGEGGED